MRKSENAVGVSREKFKDGLHSKSAESAVVEVSRRPARGRLEPGQAMNARDILDFVKPKMPTMAKALLLYNH